MKDNKHPIAVLKENLTFQQKKLESKFIAGEEGMRIRIQEKIDGLVDAIEILKSNEQGKVIVLANSVDFQNEAKLSLTVEDKIYNYERVGITQKQ